jgi:hypothetical protein
MNQNLNEEGIKSVLLQGINNDIQYEMKNTFRLSSILIEFNEQNSPMIDYKICKSVVNTLNEIFASK